MSTAEQHALLKDLKCLGDSSDDEMGEMGCVLPDALVTAQLHQTVEGMKPYTASEEEACAAVKELRNEVLGPLHIAPDDAILHGKYADIDIARVDVDVESGEVTAKRIKPTAAYSASDDYAKIGESIRNKTDNWAGLPEEVAKEEACYHRMLEPLSMCRHHSRKVGDLEKCMYYSCGGCKTVKTTGDLITVVRNSKSEPIDIWKKDLKAMLDKSPTKAMITEGCSMERLCQNCFGQVLGKDPGELSDSEFHRYVVAADANMKYAEIGLVKMSSQDYKSLATHAFTRNKKELSNLLVSANPETVHLFAAELMKDPEYDPDSVVKQKITIPVIAKFLKFCTMHPELDPGVPCITDLVSKLRGVSAIANDTLLNLCLTATDYM